jgi:hypothetical protein
VLRPIDPSVHNFSRITCPRLEIARNSKQRGDLKAGGFPGQVHGRLQGEGPNGKWKFTGPRYVLRRAGIFSAEILRG